MRHDFESGASAELVPIGALKGKHRRLLASAQYNGYAFTPDGEIDFEASLAKLGPIGRRQRFLDNRRNGTVALIVTSWSFGSPVPRIEDGEIRDEEAFDDMDLGDLLELESLMLPYTEKLTAEPDPKAPAAATTTSSDGRSRARATIPAG